MILECPACHAQFNVPDGAIPPAGRTVKCSACKHQWHATPAVIKAAPAPQPAPASRPAPQPAPEHDIEAPSVPIDHSFLEELARAADAPDESMAANEPAPAPEAPPMVEANFTVSTPPKPTKPAFTFEIWPFKLAAPTVALVWFVVAIFAYFPGWINGPLNGIYSSFGAVPTDGIVLADVAMQREEEGQRTRFLISGNIVNQEAAPRQIPIVRVQMLGPDNDVIWSREYEVGKTLKPGEIYPFRITNAETSFAHNVAQLVVDVGHPLQMMFR